MNNIFAGIIYPKRRFYFTQENEPPISAKKRLEMGKKFSQEIQFLIDFTGNNFKYDIEIYIFTKKIYKQLYIKNISYEFEGNKGTFLEDAEFILPTKICNIDENPNSSCWITNSELNYYWTRSLFMKPINKSLPKVNFEKIFKGKKPTENFKFEIKCIYNFDDESEKTEEVIFKVNCVKGEYVSPFF